MHEIVVVHSWEKFYAIFQRRASRKTKLFTSPAYVHYILFLSSQLKCIFFYSAYLYETLVPWSVHIGCRLSIEVCSDDKIVCLVSVSYRRVYCTTFLYGTMTFTPVF